MLSPPQKEVSFLLTFKIRNNHLEAGRCAVGTTIRPKSNQVTYIKFCCSRRALLEEKNQLRVCYFIHSAIWAICCNPFDHMFLWVLRILLTEKLRLCGPMDKAPDFRIWGLQVRVLSWSAKTFLYWSTMTELVPAISRSKVGYF